MPDDLTILDVMRNMRAMRRLKPDPVSDEVLVRLVEAATMAPSGSNAQTSRWIVVKDQEQKRRLAELNRRAVEVYAAPGGTRPAALPHQGEAARERQRQAFLWQTRHLHEMPALIIACIALGERRPDGFLAGLTSGGSVWPGVQNLLLAARALGLGATPTTLVFSDRAAAKEVLGLPAGIEPVCMVPVGYPLGRFGAVSRRPVAEVMRWDRWS